MRAVKLFSPAQFAFFRIVFGAYLTWHFAALAPYAAELFSDRGVLADPRVNATYGIFPNPLAWWGSPAFATGFVALLAIAAALLAVGWRRRMVSVVLWFGWAALFNRNNLIANPSIPYVGLILLFLAIVPDGEPWRWRGKTVKPSEWFMPAMVYWGAWLLMAGGYTFSGIVKLWSPSWVDGTAFHHLIDNPLARPGVVRDLFLGFPAWVHAVFTWSVLAAEILFLPMSVHRWGRCVAWTGMLIMHAGIVLMVDFADLSLGMVMIHLFTFDPDWLRARNAEGRTPVLLYDGECGLCNFVVRTLLREDARGVLRFAPLQSETGQRFLKAKGMNTEDFDSLVFIPDLGSGDRFYLRTDGVAHVLDELGGIWRVASWLRVLPQGWRDPAYKIVARLRYRLFGEYVPTPLPEPAWAGRILK
ncbi:MAG: DCC1-like thiol-disulfide oxidoreductase family protein [Nibricoccus sp.]